MERNREAWRGSMLVMNGNRGDDISRKKQRNNVLCDCPEDSVMKMHETPGLRDRGVKQDRDDSVTELHETPMLQDLDTKKDRDRFSHSKRRRIFYEDDDNKSSEERHDDEVDDDEVVVLLPPVNHLEATARNHQHHSDRKGLVSRMPSWNEINLLVPRKSRSKGTNKGGDRREGEADGGCLGSQQIIRTQLVRTWETADV